MTGVPKLAQACIQMDGRYLYGCLTYPFDQLTQAHASRHNDGEREKCCMTGSAAGTAWCGHSWLIFDQDGWYIICDGASDWLTEWRRKVRDIEGLSCPTPARRLERLLIVNATAFRAIVQHGAVAAVLAATETVVTADMRLIHAVQAYELLHWHPWPVEPGACRAFVARPNAAGSDFNLYWGRQHVVRLDTADAYQCRAAEIERLFAPVNGMHQRK